MDKIPLIYASEKLMPVAYFWKTSLNEVSKVHAFVNVLPEMNHNEIEGFVNLKGEYHGIIIRDEQDPIKIKKRMDIAKEIILAKGVPVTEIAITGKSLLMRVMTELYLGEVTSNMLGKGYSAPESLLIKEIKEKV